MGLDLPPGWAVVAIDTAANRIVAGEEKLLLHRTLEVGECRLIESDEVFGARDIRAVIRGIGRNPGGIRSGLPCRFGDSDRTGGSRVGPGRRAARRFVPRGTGRRRRNPRTVLLTNIKSSFGMDFFRVLSRKNSCDVSRIYYLCTSKTSPETAIPMRCYYNAVFAKRRVFDERDNFS